MADEENGRRAGRAGWAGRAGRQDGLEGQDAQDRREADAAVQDGESLPKRGAAELKAILEALIFASPDPLTPKAMCKLLDTEPKEDVLAALAELKQDYERPGGLQLVEVAGGYQIVTRSDLHEWVRRLFHERTTQKLTVQALETLAVIAYRQPITARGDHRGPRRQHVGRAEHAARASPDQDRRPQAGRRPAVHVRDDEGVPDSVRVERPDRSAQGRGHGRGARPRGADPDRADAVRGDAAARRARSRDEVEPGESIH